MDKKDVKIFVTYKDKHKIIKSDIITPIQTGRAIADEKFEGMIGDDTGDNISFLNDNFCELTAIYWVWRHYEEIGNPEYVGFMHYRRHFLFGQKHYNPNYYGLVKIPFADEKYLKEDLTSDENIVNQVSKYDAIISQPVDVKETTGASNIYEHYKKFHNIKDYDLAMSILEKMTPEMTKYSNLYNSSKNAYFLNMFVFKKKIFFDFCEWLFPLLFEIQANIDLTGNSNYQNRAVGFIAERLTGIFITKILEEQYKTNTLPISFIEKFKNGLIVPNENTIPIVVASSNEYIPYLSVFLESILAHSDSRYVYEIHILEQSVNYQMAQMLNEQFKDTNIRIHYIHLSSELKNIKQSCKNRHFTKETFARFFIPSLLYQYEKCLYLDIDMLVLEDLKTLYDIDLEGKSMGVIRDWVYQALCRDTVLKNLKKYTLETLKLESVENYFQGGVQVMNLKKMRENNSGDSLCKLANEMEVKFVDQCVCNCYFKNDVKYLPRPWNYQVYDRERRIYKLLNILPVSVAQEVFQAAKNPKIIHYSGPFKPWYYPDEEYAQLWWKYAKKSPFYEQILKNMASNVSEEKIREKNILKFLKDRYPFICLNYWKCKILQNLTFGNLKNHYVEKKHLLKQQIWIVKDNK